MPETGPAEAISARQREAGSGVALAERPRPVWANDSNRRSGRGSGSSVRALVADAEPRMVRADRESGQHLIGDGSNRSFDFLQWRPASGLEAALHPDAREGESTASVAIERLTRVDRRRIARRPGEYLCRHGGCTAPPFDTCEVAPYVAPSQIAATDR
jgi:hypothetical protein